MKSKSENKKLTGHHIIEVYVKQAAIEREKKESTQRVMGQQLAKATGGKNIVVSNNHR